MDEAAQFVGEDISGLNYAREIFPGQPMKSAQWPCRDKPTIPMLEIIAAVCDEFDVSQIDLCSDRRARAFTRPRDIAFWLISRFSLASLSQIGRVLGDRDHTTVMHGIKVIDREIRDRSEYGLAALRLKAMLEQRT